MKITIKKITNELLVSLVVLLSVSLAQAQPPGGQGGQRGGPPPVPDDEQIEEMVTGLSEELSLTVEQEKQVSDAYFNHFDEVAEMQKKNSRPDREVMKQMDSDFQTEVKSYLAKDQQKMYSKYLKKQQSNRERQGPHPRR